MLVSSIARFNAINNMNNAAMNMMNASNTAINQVKHTFGGEHNLSMLHEMDKKVSLDLASNSLLYKISSLQEKAAGKHQDNNNCKKSLNILA